MICYLIVRSGKPGAHEGKLNKVSPAISSHVFNPLFDAVMQRC